ncbi:MAG: hypothetical protein ACK4V6_01170 [Microthrixaceae bacterium]
MSKRKKRHPKGRASGGRVTPKGTRPGGEPPSRPMHDPSAPLLGGPLAGSLGGPPGGPGTPSRPAPPEPGGRDSFDIADLLPEGIDLGDLDLDDLAGLAGNDPVTLLYETVLIVDRLGDPLHVELWAAELVGFLRAGLKPPLPWEAPDEEWGPDGPPSEEEFFSLFVAGIDERMSGDERNAALLALHALIPYLPRGAAADARALTARHPSRTPSWARVVGTAVVERCVLIDHETDDGHQIALVARYPSTGARFLVMALIDVNMGRMAKDILIADAVDEILDEAGGDEFMVIDLDPAVARARLEDALQITEMTIDAPVSDDFDETVPLLELLLETMPAPEQIDEPKQPSAEELTEIAEQLVDMVLGPADGTPPGDVTRSRDDLLGTAALMLGFCAYRVGVAPTAWSAVRVEMFLMDHVPRKVAAPPEELINTPDELAALLPAAHELAGWGTRHLSEAQETLEHFAPEFREVIADPSSGSASKQMVMRAIAEGLDLDDPDALDTLMERVNSMGGVDAFAAGEDLTFDDDLDDPSPEDPKPA